MVLEVTIVAQNIEAWNDRHFRWNSSDEVNVELEDRLDAAVGGVLVAVVLQDAWIYTIKPLHHAGQPATLAPVIIFFLAVGSWINDCIHPGDIIVFSSVIWFQIDGYK
jgi:hypothetical protein